MSDETGSLLTTKEVAALLRVSQATVARWVRLDQLPAIRLPSGQLRIRRQDVDQLMLRLRGH
jgi:excisionase family DNA binding protein